ncbi:MAG: hypothetical protein H9872_02905 [Candidatus Cellulosilyticum pullistercoris]|uniref:Uncharacterized protein n=1 Tax=Candidatus Cellulosilyticum pullistercoris TaxID=2838521 RepID=A0A9E2KBZ0_9FIRM|nr:hypothetical protein [Candidatus Cellulosilyticum pullistercoris]
MAKQFMDQIIIKDQMLIFKDAFGAEYSLPNLTVLLHDYNTTTDLKVKQRLYEILNHDLGSLLVIEIMIDANHEVTKKRLETGEISKNMKHVHDYYVILKSHYALAKDQFEKTHALALPDFESCHFAMFPYGLVIKRNDFPNYQNSYTDISALTHLLEKSTT